jgi:hypothetical protein
MASKKSADIVLPEPRMIRSRATVISSDEGHLPMTELLFDRAGAASPFGDDLSFPMPLSELSYVHPTGDAPPAHL